MNENLFRRVSAWLLKESTLSFLRGTIRKAKGHQADSESGLVQEHDRVQMSQPLEVPNISEEVNHWTSLLKFW
jgi:hypothetical protein